MSAGKPGIDFIGVGLMGLSMGRGSKSAIYG